MIRVWFDKIRWKINNDEFSLDSNPEPSGRWQRLCPPVQKKPIQNFAWGRKNSNSGRLMNFFLRKNRLDKKIGAISSLLVTHFRKCLFPTGGALFLVERWSRNSVPKISWPQSNEDLQSCIYSLVFTSLFLSPAYLKVMSYSIHACNTWR